MTSNWFIFEPVSLYHPFNQISEVLLGISTLDNSYIFYYNMEYEKTEKRKRVERVRKVRQVIFLDQEDFTDFLRVLCSVVKKYHFILHTYCLMNNHYHLLIETPYANLSRGMRQLNGLYTLSLIHI